MLRKIVFGLMLAVLATGLLAVSFETRITKPMDVVATGTTWVVPFDFPNITSAIKSELVVDNDIIEVIPKSPPYYENVTVNKKLVIRRWSEATPGDYPIVDGGNKKGAVFNVTVPGVEIHDLFVQNGLYGILLASTSANNTIVNTTVTSNIKGIFIDCANNYLRRNKMTGNTWNFGVSDTPSYSDESFPVDHFIQNIDDSNTVAGKPICYWVNKTDGNIPTDAGYVAIVNSTGTTAENLFSLRSNCQSVLVAYSSDITVKDFQCLYPPAYFGYAIVFVNVNDSKIQNVVFSNIDDCILLRNSEKNLVQNNGVISTSQYGLISGISLEMSNDNVVTNNCIRNVNRIGGVGIYLGRSLNNGIIANNITQTQYSIILEDSNGSMIFHNNFFSNHPKPVWANSFNNSFDNGYEGNYWSDYAGSDSDGDGIGKPAYIIDSDKQDNYPLIIPWSAHRLFKRPMTVEPAPAWTQELYTCSNSTLGNATLGFTFDGTLNISLIVTSGYSGFLNLTLPRNWLDGPFSVTIDGIQVSPEITVDAKNSYINVTYGSGHHVLSVKGTEKRGIAGDLNEDGVVNFLDAIILGANFGAQG